MSYFSFLSNCGRSPNTCMHNNSNLWNKQMVINTCKILHFIKISRTHACKMTQFSWFREFAPPIKKYPPFSRKWVWGGGGGVVRYVTNVRHRFEQFVYECWYDNKHDEVYVCWCELQWLIHHVHDKRSNQCVPLIFDRSYLSCSTVAPVTFDCNIKRGDQVLLWLAWNIQGSV